MGLILAEWCGCSSTPSWLVLATEFPGRAWTTAEREYGDPQIDQTPAMDGSGYLLWMGRDTLEYHPAMDGSGYLGVPRKSGLEVPEQGA